VKGRVGEKERATRETEAHRDRRDEWGVRRRRRRRRRREEDME
jgi:hypothetical protein